MIICKGWGGRQWQFSNLQVGRTSTIEIDIVKDIKFTHNNNTTIR